MEHVVLCIALFMLGAALSSAADCALWKLHRGQSWVRGRSVCEGCGKELRWWEIIPVVSALLLRGKCPRCGYYFGMSRSLTEATFGVSLAVYVVAIFGRSTALDIFYIVFYITALLLVAKLHQRRGPL